MLIFSMENSDTEFIDIHHVQKKFEKRIENLKKDKNIIERNRKLILNFIDDCRKGKTIKNRAKKKISIGRCLKYISELKILSQWFNKPFDEVTEKDMEKLIENLEENKYKVKTRNGKIRDYSEKTKLDFKKDLKKFYKWLLGENEKYFALTSWIDTHEEMQEIPALTRAEIEKMADACNTRDKAIVMVLFDSGARIQEFLNLRIGDLTKKQEENYYMIRIKHSKTKPRTISIPMCTTALDNWLAIHPEKDNPNAQLFPLSYDAVRMLLKRIGRKILKKEINPHLFRHSSATYYCHKLNQYQLCYRYGWSMASSQPARYIDREGIHEEEIAEKIKEDEVARLKRENQNLRESISLLQSEQGKIMKAFERRSKFDFLLDKIIKNEKFQELLKKELNISQFLLIQISFHISLEFRKLSFP